MTTASTRASTFFDQQVLLDLGLTPLGKQRRKNICAQREDQNGCLGAEDVLVGWKVRGPQVADPEGCGGPKFSRRAADTLSSPASHAVGKAGHRQIEPSHHREGEH